jgi:copper chaperone CopZ
MREKIQLDQIRCERCVTRLTGELSPIEGLTEARVEMGTSSVIVDYDEASGPQLEQAFRKGGFQVVFRQPLEPGAFS